MKRFKKLSALLLAAVMLVSLIPGNVVRADGEWYITFAENQNYLKEIAENPPQDNENDGKGMHYAYISQTSALGRFAFANGFDYFYPWVTDSVAIDVSGEIPQVVIIEDNFKYTGFDFISSKIDSEDIDTLEYYFSSVDLSDFSYDADWGEVWCEEKVYDEVILAPNEMIDVRAAMPEYNNKTDIFFIEIYSNSGEEFDYYGLYGPYVFRSQLEGHAGKLVEDISEEDSNEIYRIRDPKTNEHLLTSDPNEVVYWQLRGWERETSMGTGLDANDPNAVPVYRIVNTKNKEHLYTTDINEVEYHTSRGSWAKDNGGDPLFYGSKEGAVAVYRLNNTKAVGPAGHLVTSDTTEINYLTANKGFEYDNGGEPIFYIP